MSGKDTSINDLAVAISDLGTMVTQQIGDLKRELTEELTGQFTGQIGSLRQELTGQISSLRSELKAEIAELRRAQLETNERLSSLEGEMEALHNDLKEIYDRIAKLEKRLDKAAPEDYMPLRREVDEIKAWARDISVRNGLPAPKFS